MSADPKPDAAEVRDDRRRPKPSRDIADLVAIMAALRTPETGCQWDLAQDFGSLAPYAIEEAYEVADAVARGDLHDLCDELGDLLLQVVFHAQLGRERGAFDFGSVVEAITAKLIRRHPHVFGDARALSPERVKALWDEIKEAEKAERAARLGTEPEHPSVLSGVPVGLPALVRSDKLTRKAAKVGFTWTKRDEVIGKIEEELAELRAADDTGDPDAVTEEFGDLLFTVANLGRYLDVDPEAALAAANRKFERRFGAVERALVARGSSPAQSTLEQMDRLWDEAKAAERAL